MSYGPNIRYIVQAGGSLQGTARVAGDKSISHRSIMLGALAKGTTHVTGFLEGEDSLNTLKAFRAMGVTIEGPNQGKVTIQGVGLRGLIAPKAPLDMGNSGTAMRLMSGILAGQAFDSTLIGDASLSKRPMKRVTNPLALMGAHVDSQGEKGVPPLVIHGGSALKGIHYDLPMASAQVKSCVLLAGLYAEGETAVTEPAPTRDHTERMLRGFGYDVITEGNRMSLIGGGELTATDIDVPADISSAAFFMVAASIAPNSDVVLQHVGINPTRTGVIDILRLMGADISLSNEKEVGGEPVADIRVRSAQLKGIAIPESLVPLAIDEFPVLFVAAACALGTTVLTGAEELRVKESDRIAVMATALQQMGISATPTEDGCIIEGGQLTPPKSPIQSHGDHRIAMASAVAALKVNSGEVVINDCANVNTSFPGFVSLAAGLGLAIRQEMPA
ncbi:MAG: 3-phosphoshikimate 1-carboxyvinyltransferase [Gammaproteobacteria bacterium]|nr:3-phosphoshikimate 1-carboxyvinyltransferase [Gammaproteobacteria bacterium]